MILLSITPFITTTTEQLRNKQIPNNNNDNNLLSKISVVKEERIETTKSRCQI